METNLLDIITKSIASIGLVNTLIGIAITVTLGYLYRNKNKSNKLLSDTVQNQNDSIIDAIDNQNILLVEIQRTSNGIMEGIKEVAGKIDGFMTLVVGLVQRDVHRDNDGGE